MLQQDDGSSYPYINISRLWNLLPTISVRISTIKKTSIISVHKQDPYILLLYGKLILKFILIKHLFTCMHFWYIIILIQIIIILHSENFYNKLMHSLRCLSC